MKRITTAVASLLLMAGCATSTLNIDPETNSEALQVARAATLFEVRDQKIPQSEFNRLADSTAYNAAWATTMYFNPAKGFSSGSSLALALPSLLLNNKPADSFNHVLAWMPADLAESKEEASNKMNEILLDALVKTAADLNHANYKANTFKAKGRYITYLDIVDNDLECFQKDDYYCSLANRIYPPRLTTAPHVLKKYSEQPAYFFPLKKTYTLMFLKRNKELPVQNQLEFLTIYSQHLPDWVYLYIGPKTIHDAEGKQLNYPFILHQGKTMLFLKPETD